MGGFLASDGLNTRYTERPGADFAVNGRETYWAISEWFLYWCPHEDVWKIAWPEAFEGLRSGGPCDFSAVGPPSADILDAAACGSGWSEWDDALGDLVARLGAGVDVLSTEGRLAAGAGERGMGRVLSPPCLGLLFQHGARNQFQCNNCWAQAATQILEMLVCEASGGFFTGPAAELSVAYLTSCAREAWVGSNGCQDQGGDTAVALRWAAEHGLPTGGPLLDPYTCVPSFADMKVAPPCPQNCTNPRYPRSLQEDLFVPEGLNETWLTNAFESAVHALQSGPIAITFPVYEDFTSYTSGTYSHKWGGFLFYHICAAFGHGPDFIQAYNSWGQVDWGAGGTFNISKDAIRSYIIPGRLLSIGSERLYPLPFGNRPTIVTLSGFQNELLNGEYHEGGAAIVNQHSVYWNWHGKDSFPPPPDTCLLYWCDRSKQWMVVSHAPELDSIKQGTCPWDARSPTIPMRRSSLKHVVAELSFAQGWLEQSGAGTGVHVRPHAGIAHVAWKS